MLAVLNTAFSPSLNDELNMDQSCVNYRGLYKPELKASPQLWYTSPQHNTHNQTHQFLFSYLN